jgi:transcriptional regulator with XRE-family HTH domain
VVLRSVQRSRPRGSWCRVAIVASWTGAETKALRQAMRLSVRHFAARLGVDARAVTKWESRGASITLLPETQAIMDTALGQASEDERVRFASILSTSNQTETDAALLEHAVAPDGASRQTPAPAGDVATPSVEAVDSLTAEILYSHMADEAIEQLARATTSLAESHTQVPARRVLKQVFQLHRHAQRLVRSKQRLSQQRELFRIESDLLAHACVLLDDMKQNKLAQRYGTAALLFAHEAGSNQAIARSALAKTLRWAERLDESADIARLGYECSPMAPIRIQLASQEANAAALLGDASRAREALSRADVAAELVLADSGLSAWSFPTGRQAIFALSVAMYTGDAGAALRAAARADDGWASGEPMVSANWAQIRVGAGIAHLSQGSLDAAIEEVRPVLSLAPELRVSTVTAYMDRLDSQLRLPQLNGNKAAAELRSDIRDFNAAALLDDQPMETR